MQVCILQSEDVGTDTKRSGFYNKTTQTAREIQTTHFVTISSLMMDRWVDLPMPLDGGGGFTGF